MWNPLLGRAGYGRSDYERTERGKTGESAKDRVQLLGTYEGEVLS